MDRGSIPQDQQLALNVAQQVLEKLDHIRPFIRPFLHRHVEFTFGREGVGAQHQGQQVEPRLVGPVSNSSRCLHPGSVPAHKGELLQVNARPLARNPLTGNSGLLCF